MNKTNFQLPFDGSWLTSWGGDTKELNRHHPIAAQKYAFDFVVTDETGETYKNKGLVNKDYFCFGKEILAPADGEIVEVIDGVRDNTPGDTNPYMLTGNYILIKHDNSTFSLLAHLKKNSVDVKLGDSVKIGQQIGECGNSGNSSEAHLHYHLQDSFVFNRFGKNWKLEDVAQGVKVQFSSVELNRNGKKIIEKAYSPIKGDIVSNAIKPGSENS